MLAFGAKKPRVILLFGPPGAGKGTIGQMLCAAGNHFHLSSGSIFRRLSPESENGKLFHEFASQGKLVPDEITIEIWRKYTQGLIDTNRFYPAQQMLMLDGIPRTVGQAKMLEELVDVFHIIVLDVHDEDELIRRISRRAIIEKRLDDADEKVVRQRIEEYKEKSIAVLKYFPKEVISRYNADNTPMEVLRDVLVGSTPYLKEMPDLLPYKKTDEALEKPPIEVRAS